jgi:hypothetical protein
MQLIGTLDHNLPAAKSPPQTELARNSEKPRAKHCESLDASAAQYQRDNSNRFKIIPTENVSDLLQRLSTFANTDTNTRIESDPVEVSDTPIALVEKDDGYRSESFRLVRSQL